MIMRGSKAPEPTPVLLKAALAHVQFETIHPFLDGNGHLGRLLITLLLCEQKVLREPMLYLSLYFKTHRQYYYELLGNVRLTGDWKAWLDFFAEAVIVTATQAVETAQQLLDLSNRDRDKISSLGRAAASTLQVHRALMEHPIATSGSLVEKTGITPATVNKALGHLEQLGIVKELTQPPVQLCGLYRDHESRHGTAGQVGQFDSGFRNRIRFVGRLLY
jgi:Fic family protein